MKKFLLACVMLAACVPALTFQLPKEATPKPREESASKPDASRITSKVVDAGQLLEDVRVLAGDAMEGRGAGTHGGALARAYIIRRFNDAGVGPLWSSFEQPFDLPGVRTGEARTGVNVVGVVRGKSHPERFVVVTAHYDHLGIRNGQIYNGADDNASGVAALLQLAAHFNRERPENSMIFAALDAEEIGLVGAYALVRQFQAERRDVALDFNLDMVSHNDRGELYAAGAYRTPALKTYLEEVAARAPVKLLLGHDRPDQGHDDWTDQSDQYAFHKAGIPWVYFGVEDHKDYHKPSDKFDTITPVFFVRAAETLLDALQLLDRNLATLEQRRV
ncbi:MAG TPA: M28 family peptidase [Pyrinomonadaceae bacterium]|nr:M28 family peptidase [Pyrinomonadaceae bacterium]